MRTLEQNFAGLGRPTGVYCTPLEFAELIDIIREVQKTSVIEVKGNAGSGMIIPKKEKTQADVFSFVSKLAEKHGLPFGFYGINKNREFIQVIQGREDDFHNVYN